jgi:hypothetical protein
MHQKARPMRSEMNCLFVDCRNSIRSRGLCNKHYIQQRRSGALNIKQIDVNAPLFDIAKSLLKYSADDGVFYWASDWFVAKAGDVAGRINKNGYRIIGLCGRQIYAHRLAWLFVNGVEPTSTIDHIDGNRQNNAIVNLRDVSMSINSQNLKGAKAGNKSGLLGVAYRKDLGKWQSGITIGGQQTYLGVFDNKEDAHAAYLVAKRQRHAGCTI